MTKDLNVLLVEDSDDDAALLHRQLKAGGYVPAIRRVESASDMRQALENGAWDVVISDYTLPRFSGLAALSILKERGSDIPFILISGTIGEDAAVEAMKAGAHDYVMKSNLTRLVPAVERELRETAMRRRRLRGEKVQAATYKISQSAGNAKDLPDLFASIHTIIGELMPAKNFYVSLYNQAEQTMSFPYFVDEFEPPPPPQPVNHGLTEYVLRNGKPILVTQELFRQLEEAGEITLVGAPSVNWLGAPLRNNGSVIGVLVVQSYTPGIKYTDEDLGILEFVSTQVAMVLTRLQGEKALRQSEERYRSLFENSPISMWEEDFSQVKHEVEQIRRQGVENFRAYFASHPEVVERLLHKVRLIDVNETTLKLYGARRKSELIEKLADTQGKERHEVFLEELVAIAEGRQEFEATTTNRKLTGEEIDIYLRWSITPEYAGTLSRLIVSVIDISERKQSERMLKAQLQRLDALRTIDMAITASMDLRVTLDVLLDQVVTQLHVDAADILSLNPTTKTLEYIAGRGFHGVSITRARLQTGQGFAGRVALERRLYAVPDLSQVSDLVRSHILQEENFAAYFGVPLLAKGQVKGVLEVFHRSPLHPAHDWLDFLETLGGQAAIAIDNATLFENLQRSNIELAIAYDATIEGWSRALDLRDKETEGHTQRVTEMTLRLAEAMGLSDEQRLHIRRGALLHDIGKMGISDSILLMPGPLTKEKWEVMQKHPVYALELLSPIAYLQPSLDIPYCHHEKWDGTGYPRGLEGEQIPLSARIFAVVDVYDALRSDRPYRSAWPEEKVCEHLRSQAGKHFDPRVVELFLSMRRRGEI